jgi:pimeloyl-ACP methyl ester carboxylesterase
MTRAPAPSGTHTLSDGRTIAWNEHGDPADPAVIYAVGAPSGRFMVREFDDFAAGAGVRIIVPDRPGIGASTEQPERRIIDWPADVRQLADHLGLERYWVVGGSGGGPYALACAVDADPRLQSVSVVVGIGPLDTPEARARLKANRPVFELAAAEGVEGLRPFVETITSPAALEALGSMVDAMSAPDQAAMRDHPDIVTDLFDYGDATAAGPDGLAYDLVLFTRPWEFDPADIACRVDFFASDHDDNVPLPFVVEQFLAVRDASLTVWPDSGHLHGVVRLPEVLAALRTGR